jgi:hypothetical protein
MAADYAYHLFSSNPAPLHRHLVVLRNAYPLRAERRAGAMLNEMEKAKGGWSTSCSPQSVPQDRPQTLADLDISKNQSSQWQNAAILTYGSSPCVARTIYLSHIFF